MSLSEVQAFLHAGSGTHSCTVDGREEARFARYGEAQEWFDQNRSRVDSPGHEEDYVLVASFWGNAWHPKAGYGRRAKDSDWRLWSYWGVDPFRTHPEDGDRP